MADKPRVAGTIGAPDLFALVPSHLWADIALPASGDTRTDALRLTAELKLVDGRLVLEAGAYFSTETILHEDTSWLGLRRHRFDAEFGLSGGELRVALHNGRAPLSLRHAPEMAETVELDYGTESERSSELGATVGGELGKEPKLTLELTGKLGRKYAAKSHVVSISAVMVAKGADDFPGWQFSSHQNGLALWGRAPKAGKSLATIEREGEAVAAVAGFIVRASDIICLSMSAVKPRDVVRAAIAQRAFPRKLFDSWNEKGRGKVGVALAAARFPNEVAAAAATPPGATGKAGDERK